MNCLGSRVAVLVDLLILLSCEATGHGTQHNQFSFVNLDSSFPLFPSTSYHYRTERISPAITFGSSTYNSAYISRNGFIHFRDFEPIKPDYYSIASYAGNTDYVIAPFWENMYSGHIKYQLFASDHSQEINRVSDYIFNVLGVYPSVETLLVVEWYGMVSESSNQDRGTNRFQTIVTSSTIGQSYVIFTYKCGELQWSDRPVIGYHAQGSLYRDHPYSFNWTSPNPIACVNYPESVYSNVVYRIDNTDSTLQYCEDYQFGCSSGKCIENFSVCNGYLDCIDGTDEVGCSPVPCYSDQFSCRRGGCISLSKKCDGTRDCSDGSDEKSCSQISTGSILGIIAAGLVVTLVFCAVIVAVIHQQVKQRNRRRVQFQRLRSELSVQPQTTPSTQTRYFHPKPGEWYQTIEGHWVQGPPPAYSPGEEEGNPLSDGEAVVLIGGSEDTAASSPAPNDDVPVESTSLPASDDQVPSPTTQFDSSIEVVISPNSAALNEVGVASDEGNPLEASSSGSSVEDSENSPLIIES